MTELRLLVLGGTSFVGRALVEQALARGHRVTTFNRGQTGPDAAGVRALRGDRSVPADLGILAGTVSDAVIDPSGQVPVQVLRALEVLRSSVPFCAYISSAAIYRDWTRLPWAEDAPAHPAAADDAGDPADLRTLGPRKSGCEQAVRQVYGDAALVVRPGLIVGPHDNVGMLPWWLRRVRQGGRVLAPGDPGRPLQLIDARDLAAFVLDRVEARCGGVLNTMPTEPVRTMGEFLRACVTATGARARLLWVGDEFLAEHGAAPWNEIPFWLPAAPNPAAAWPVDASAAHAAGLRCRPLPETVRATWDWLRAGGRVHPVPGSPPIGLSRGKEDAILTAHAAAARSRGALPPVG